MASGLDWTIVRFIDPQDGPALATRRRQMTSREPGARSGRTSGDPRQRP